jgi:cell division transport system permease protein
LALFVIGLFGLLALQANELTSVIKQNLEVQVYLNKDLSENQLNRIKLEMENSGYLNIDEATSEASIKFVSKEEAAQQFVEETGEDFSSFLGDNPLRDAFVLNLAPDYQTNAKMDSLSTEIEQINGVFEVTYVKNLADSIDQNITKTAAILIGVALLLVLVVILLINNTIKLALFSQRFLIRSMQLVGAKSGFIKKPFLRRSFLYGAISGVIASGLLYGILTFANQKIERLEELQKIEMIVMLFIVLIALGAFISWFSTARAMNKYLKMSLDELY